MNNKDYAIKFAREIEKIYKVEYTDSVDECIFCKGDSRFYDTDIIHKEGCVVLEAYKYLQDNIIDQWYNRSMTMDNEWKDLDISNIPSDFFVNKRYEVQRSSIYGEEEWVFCTTEPNDRWKQIQISIEGQIKYRYRLKPLEPIRITKRMMEDLEIYNSQRVDCDILETIYKRPVEIID